MEAVFERPVLSYDWSDTCHRLPPVRDDPLVTARDITKYPAEMGFRLSNAAYACPKGPVLYDLHDYILT